LLLGLFIFISILVYKAYHKRVKEGRATLWIHQHLLPWY
jgi:hypothetical protein